MKASKTKIAKNAGTADSPKTLHRVRVRPKRGTAKLASPRRDNTFSQSRDTREDRGESQMKTSHSARTFPMRGELMKSNPLKQGALTENSAGIGTVTRAMVRERAVELAVINGRSAQEVLASDWEQAKRELTGEAEMDPQEAVLESAPESERWNPLPGSCGHKMPAAPSADEDDEGRSDNERLVEEGIAGAEHDQMRRAAKEPAKEDHTAI